MSKAQSKIPSPARSQGALTPRRHRTRRTLSVASPARSDASGRLSSVVEKFINNDKFTMSPLNRRSVLPDDTEIDAPRRASWWKRLDGSSRDVLEALDTNKMPDDLAMEEYEFEVEKGKQNQTVSESSDNESLASIVVPHKRLFNQKKQPQAKFGDIMGSRKSLGRTNIEDVSIDDAPKNLFNKGPRNKPVFPAALLNSTNKTINKTVEPETNKQTRPNLFGQAGTKRKNVFTDFVVSESEEDSEVQHKAFGFKRNDNKRMSFGTRNRRMPSLTPSMTTEIDIDDWNLLPSSTMIDNAIGVPEVSRIITDQDLELAQEENHDNTLTEENANPETDKIKSIQNKSLNRTKLGKSVTQKDDNDETLTNEDIETEDISERQKIKDLSKKLNKTHNHSKSVLHDRVKDKSLQNKTFERTVDENEEIIENVAAEQEQDNVANGPSIEQTMAAIHGVSNVQNQESLQKTFILEKDKGQEEVKTIAEGQINQNQAKQANKTNQDEDMAEILENDKRREELQLNTEGQKSFQQVNHDKQDDNMADISEKDKTKNAIERSAGEQEIQNSSKEVSHENQDEKDKSEKETELSAEEQETQDSSKEASQENQNEDVDDTSEKDESDQEIEESHNSSRETSNENHDEDMEKMVWDDNNDERSSENADRKENGESKQEIRPIRASQSKNVSNKSQKIVEPFVESLQVEEENDVVNETPNNSTHDTTGRNWKKDSTEVKSPEAVLQNITTDNESFRPIGRSTTFRKSKSVIDNINIRHSLDPVQESTIGSEGSRNSSTEGSGWDSHRTTRKTIRQTFGKNCTPRKSLRALVMEQSAKRQTELYNKSTSTMVKNKTVLVDAKNQIASKINKTSNKTVSEDNERNASKINKTKNKSVLEDVNEHHIRDRKVSNPNLTSNELSSAKSRVHGTSTRHMSDPLISEPQVSYHKSFDNINEPEISKQEISNREESINISEPANNDSGPEISMHASYGQGMSAEDSDHAISEVYATTNHDNSGKEKTANKSSKELSQRIKSIHVTSDHEMLDYEASEKSEEELSEPEEGEHEDSNQDTTQDDSVQELSDQEEEKEDSDPEEFENEVEPEESEQEQNEEESLEEIEHQCEQEESRQETEADSEQEETQQEIDAESVQEESQQEIEAESEEEEESVQEESQQEIEAESEEEESQQEIEAESEEEESQQEIRAESENEQDHHMSQSVNDISDYESDPENADNSVEPEREMVSDQDEDQEDSDNFVSGLNSQYQMSNSNRTERVVFDNEISDQEIDYELSERVSRQITENDISEQMSERQPTPELTNTRVSEHSGAHDVSVGTKKSMLLMQMQKIAQQNMEMRHKIREKVQNSLKPTRNYNFNKMSPIQSKFSIRRINKAEPKKVKSKPKRTGIPVEALPKEFVEDLMYKPPKRFQPANAPWITKRLYKFLETKLEPKYDYRARVRAEELVHSIYSFAKVVRRRDVAPAAAVDELKREMARLHIVNTHFDFYEFFHEFMPREIRVKVNPDVMNKIPMPRDGVFAEILPSRSAVA